MKQPHRRWNICTALLLGAWLGLGTGLPVEAARKGKEGPKTALEMVSEQQELMTRECKLSDEQTKTVQEKFKLKAEALTSWEKANADKLKAAEEAAATARKGTDAAAKRAAAESRKELETSRTEATAAADQAILGVLTDAQKEIWAGVELARTTLPRYQRMDLTEDQTAAIKSACTIAARDLAAFSGDDKKAKQGRTTLQKSLQWAIDNVILTADQRAKRAKK